MKLSWNPIKEVDDLRKKLTTGPRITLGVVLGAVLAVTLPALAADGPAAATGPRESQVCLDCHDDMAATLHGGPHMVLVGGDDSRIACTDCHGGPAAHWEDDAEEYPLANPAKMGVMEASGVCLSCHFSAHAENQATLSPHADADVTCLDCHQVHGGTGPAGLHREQIELCLSCHLEQRGEFARPFSHPVGGGAVTCADCHLQDDDAMAPLTMQGGSAVCLECHGEFQGPFPYDHQAAVDYSVEEGGCLNCHDPHGSYQPMLLTQPYEPPHFQLCTQCHVVPLHNYNTQHGSEFAGVSCSECHTDIHGSYTNRNYLTTALEAQGCFAAGCHSR